jgi:hypothetical protein
MTGLTNKKKKKKKKKYGLLNKLQILARFKVPMTKNMKTAVVWGDAV